MGRSGGQSRGTVVVWCATTFPKDRLVKFVLQEDSDRLGDRRGLERDSSATTPHDGMPQATVEVL